MALFRIPIIFCSFYAFSAFSSFTTRQALILVSGESRFIYSLIIVTSITSIKIKEIKEIGYIIKKWNQNRNRSNQLIATVA